MKKENNQNTEACLILHNIRSSLNVGSLFRTADASRIKTIYLSGYTPSPIGQFQKINRAIAKTALGAEDTVEWKKVSNIKNLISRLKKENFKIIAIEQDKKSIDYKKVKKANKTAFVLGNEVRGLSKSVLDSCDVVAEIPMKGKKESLNVSVAGGVAIFRIMGI